MSRREGTRHGRSTASRESSPEPPEGERRRNGRETSPPFRIAGMRCDNGSTIPAVCPRPDLLPHPMIQPPRRGERREHNPGRRDWYAVPMDRCPPILHGRLPTENTGLRAEDPQMQAYAYVLQGPVQDAWTNGVEDARPSDRIWVVTEGGGPNGEHRFTIERVGALNSRRKGSVRQCRDFSQRHRYYWWIPLSDQ